MKECHVTSYKHKTNWAGVQEILDQSSKEVYIRLCLVQKNAFRCAYSTSTHSTSTEDKYTVSADIEQNKRIVREFLRKSTATNAEVVGFGLDSETRKSITSGEYAAACFQQKGRSLISGRLSAQIIHRVQTHGTGTRRSSSCCMAKDTRNRLPVRGTLPRPARAMDPRIRSCHSGRTRRSHWPLESPHEWSTHRYSWSHQVGGRLRPRTARTERNQQYHRFDLGFLLLPVVHRERRSSQRRRTK